MSEKIAPNLEALSFSVFDQPDFSPVDNRVYAASRELFRKEKYPLFCQTSHEITEPCCVFTMPNRGKVEECSM